MNKYTCQYLRFTNCTSRKSPGVFFDLPGVYSSFLGEPADPSCLQCGQQHKVLLLRNSALWTAPRPALPTLEFQHCALADWAQGLCGRKYDHISTKVHGGSCLEEGTEIGSLAR